MYAIKLDWKEYNVSLPMVSGWVRDSIGSAYSGCSADTALTLWFSSEPSDMQRQLIQDYWDDMTLQSPEATSYVSQQSIEEAIADLRATMVEKSWDELTIAERKLIMGQSPTLEELGLA